MTHDEAIEFHLRNRDNLIIWTVTENPSDFPGKFTARPTVCPAEHADPKDGVLVADSLDEIRTLLPASLCRLNRYPDDDPVIVEVWF